MTKQILENWEQLENYNLQQGCPPNTFCPEHMYDCQFLINKIKSAQPDLPEVIILLAVYKTRRAFFGPCDRELFVNKVVEDIQRRMAGMENIA